MEGKMNRWHKNDRREGHWWDPVVCGKWLARLEVLLRSWSSLGKDALSLTFQSGIGAGKNLVLTALLRATWECFSR